LIIDFRKVSASPCPINLRIDGLSLDGTFQKKSKNIVSVNANLKGTLNLPCDSCGEDFDLDINENLELQISNGVLDNVEEFDIIEIFDEKIDFDDIISSEIENIKLDFNHCQNCKDNKKEFEFNLGD
jgi:uncharacterized metal-binding protein YceD (DUF177 family)